MEITNQETINKKLLNRDQLIYKIAKRGYPAFKNFNVSLLDLILDISAVDINYGLKLEEFLKSDLGNFLHDIIGIYNNLNRKTKKLENCFTPRFIK
jgi:hypothetical protein